eukprot:5388926-Prymnesium_polylepis.1
MRERGEGGAPINAPSLRHEARGAMHMVGGEAMKRPTHDDRMNECIRLGGRTIRLGAPAPPANASTRIHTRPVHVRG